MRSLYFAANRYVFVHLVKYRFFEGVLRLTEREVAERKMLRGPAIRRGPGWVSEMLKMSTPGMLYWLVLL